MKIESIDLGLRPTLQTARIDGLAQRDLRSATWRGDDLLIRKMSGDVLVLKGALVKLLAKPAYFLVLDDVPVPLALFAPQLPQAHALGAPHVPPFSRELSIAIGRSPKGRGGIERGLATADESWADQAWAMLAATERYGVEPVDPTTPEQALAQQPPKPAPARSPVAEAPPATADEGTGGLTAGGEAAAVVPAEPAAASGGWFSSLSTWTLLGWAAVGTGVYQIASRQGSAPAPAPFQAQIQGMVMLGPVVAGNDLKVVVVDGNGQALGAAATVDDTGAFTFQLTRRPVGGVVKVIVEGGDDAEADYADEAQLKLASFAGVDSLQAYMTWVEGRTSPVTVTPLTDLLARKIGASPTQDALTAASKSLALALGLGDGTAGLEDIQPRATVKVGLDGSVTREANVANAYGRALDAHARLVKAAREAQNASWDEIQAGLLPGLKSGSDGRIGLDASHAAINGLKSAAGNRTPTVNGEATLVVNGTVGAEFTPLDLSMRFKDEDSGDKLSYALASGTLPAGLALDPATGLITGTPTGTAALQATLGVVATDRFGATARLSLTVNIAAKNNAPSATDQTLTLAEDTTRVLKAVDFGLQDPDGHRLKAVHIQSLPAAGGLLLDGVAVTVDQVIAVADLDAGKLAYTPAPNAHGEALATLKFKVQDKGGTANGGIDLSAQANTLTFTVTAVNDAPTAVGTVPDQTARAGTVFPELDLSKHYADADAGDTLRYAVKDGNLPAGLMLDPVTGKISGTPTATTAEPMPVTIAATDAGGLSATQVVRFTITGINSAPSASDKTVTLQEDGSIVLLAADFGYTDVDGHALKAVHLTALPQAGTLTLDGKAVAVGQVIDKAALDAGKLAYRPAADGHGPTYAALQFKVQDNGGTLETGVDLSALANTLTFAVTPVNDAPSATGAVPAQFAAVGKPAELNLSAWFADVDLASGDTLSYGVKTGTLPAGLVLDPATGRISGTPTAVTTDPLKVTFEATDKGGLSATQAVTFNVAVASTAAIGLSSTVTATATAGSPRLDVRSNLALTGTDAVVAGQAGKFVHLVWDGFVDGASTGLAGQTRGNDYTIEANSPLVTFSGQQVVINPSAAFDLDFGSRYRVRIDEAAFIGRGGNASDAVTGGLVFETVMPGQATTSSGLAPAVASVLMGLGDTLDTLVAGYQWLNVANVGEVRIGTLAALPATTLDLAGGRYAIVGGRDINAAGASDAPASDGVVVDAPFWVRLNNFKDDLVYVDDQRADAAARNNPEKSDLSAIGEAPGDVGVAVTYNTASTAARAGFDIYLTAPAPTASAELPASYREFLAATNPQAMVIG